MTPSIEALQADVVKRQSWPAPSTNLPHGSPPQALLKQNTDAVKARFAAATTTPDGELRVERIAAVAAAVVVVVRCGSGAVDAASAVVADRPRKSRVDCRSGCSRPNPCLPREGPGERKSGGGILIPPPQASASVSSGRTWWPRVHVRQVCVDDRVLFDPEDRAEVELQSKDYLLLRERDLHAVAAAEIGDHEPTGLYLWAQPTGIPASRHAANPPSIAGGSNVSPSAPTRAMRRR